MRARLMLAVLLGAAVTTLPAGPSSAEEARCDGAAATIVGTPGADVLVGTPGPDVIAGLGGNDVIRAGDGDDLVCGGRGADQLFGEAGDDRLFAGPAQRIDDRGGSGFRPDVLDGGPGDDWLDIGQEPGGGVGQKVSGEVRFGSAPDGVVLDLTRGTATGDGDDTVVARPGLRVVGTDADDVLTGSNLPEEILGQGGADRIRGLDGSDHLYGDTAGASEGAAGVDDDWIDGGDGKDVVIGTLGADVLRGGPGMDLVEATGSGPSRVAGGTGDDFLTLTLGTGEGAVAGGGPGRDDVTLDLHGDVPGRPTVGVRRPDQVLALDGDEVGGIRGAERVRAADRVRMDYIGTAARDTVFAGLHGRLRARTYAGDDVVFGSRLADRIDGGAGRDEADGRGGRDVCVRVEVERSC